MGMALTNFYTAFRLPRLTRDQWLAVAVVAGVALTALWGPADALAQGTGFSTTSGDPTAGFTTRMTNVEGWIRVVLAGAVGALGLGFLVAKVAFRWGTWWLPIGCGLASVIIASWGLLKTALFATA